LSVRFCDDEEWGFGWIAPEPAFMERCSHALVADGRVWLTDVVELWDLDDRVRDLGEPAGVIQLLDRHERDCAAVAKRFGIPHHVVPFERVGPFEPVTVSRARFWREVALWWEERRVLVCADALSTSAYYRAGDEPLAVHPILRLHPPRALGALAPDHVLCGHGPGIHGAGTADAVRTALATARRRLPAAWFGAARRALVS
jgi:hypothetical protein